MVDILNLALPYFGLIFIGFACGPAGWYFRES
jgi:malonate transporter and related proteins